MSFFRKIINDVQQDTSKIEETCISCGAKTDMLSGNPDNWPILMWDGVLHSGKLAVYCLACQNKMISLYNDYKL